jgi:hypothetical protein
VRRHLPDAARHPTRPITNTTTTATTATTATTRTRPNISTTSGTTVRTNTNNLTVVTRIITGGPCPGFDRQNQCTQGPTLSRRSSNEGCVARCKLLVS